MPTPTTEIPTTATPPSPAERLAQLFPPKDPAAKSGGARKLVPIAGAIGGALLWEKHRILGFLLGGMLGNAVSKAGT